MPLRGEGMEAGRLCVEDLGSDNIEIDEHYALRWKEAPVQYKRGYKFRMRVADATGEIPVTFWGGKDETSVREAYNALRVNSMVRLVGSTGTWNEHVVININPDKGGMAEPAGEGDYDPDDFVPRTAKDVGEMFSAIMSYAESIEEPHIRSVLLSMLSDGQTSELLKRSPASVSYHCGWVGGLLEHTLNVVKVCDSLSRLYDGLDRDLLLAGAILHDIGKVSCYDVGSTISESADGRMVGHIAIGAGMVGRACDALPDFPPVLRMKLVHMVLASHGAPEKGSPVLPSIPEAAALNHADEIDATVERFVHARKSGGSDDTFTYDPHLRTKVFML